MIWKGFRRALILLTLVSLLCGASGETVYTVRKTKAYAAASTGAAKIAVPAGLKLDMIASSGDWAQVRRGGRTAYVPSGDVAALQILNVTAYTKSATAVYKTYGSTKVWGSIPKDVRLTAISMLGERVYVRCRGKKGFIPKDALTLTEPETTVDPQEETPGRVDPTSGATVARGKAKDMDWWTSDIQTIFAKGVTATITDVETGIAWREMRKGGSKHADCQPLTAKDTAALKKAVGKYSWDRRAIFVTIDGVNYAASMNCKPHGGGSITGNNFDGHHCIHFTNSRTDGTDIVCPYHKAAIQKALKANLK